MASSIIQVTLLSFFLLFNICYAQSSFRPHALVLPVSRDASTLQYVTKINQRTPSIAVNFVLDLGGRFLWVDCDKITFHQRIAQSDVVQHSAHLPNPTHVGIASMDLDPGATITHVVFFTENTITHTSTSGELAQDVVTVPSTDGSSSGPLVTVPRFLFSCAPSLLLEGLANGATGMAGLGRTRIALPTQFSSAFSFHRKFAICLSSATSASGVIFFGDGPYNLLPNVDASQLLRYTPLFINPVSTAGVSSKGEPSDEYFIGVKSIKITQRAVPLNTSLLSIDRQGKGGTKISTVDPYTVVETSIFKAIAKVFTEEAATRNISRVASVAPFDVCFSTKNIFSTRLGPSVPWIDLVLQNQSVVWTITGSNSMVQVNDNVLCLGFIDGGSNPRTSIVIGGYQLEDNLLQFDLAASRLGLSATLFGARTTCANFNFTTPPKRVASSFT